MTKKSLYLSVLVLTTLCSTRVFSKNFNDLMCTFSYIPKIAFEDASKATLISEIVDIDASTIKTSPVDNNSSLCPSYVDLKRPREDIYQRLDLVFYSDTKFKCRYNSQDFQPSLLNDEQELPSIIYYLLDCNDKN